MVQHRQYVQGELGQVSAIAEEHLMSVVYCSCVAQTLNGADIKIQRQRSKNVEPALGVAIAKETPQPVLEEQDALGSVLLDMDEQASPPVTSPVVSVLSSSGRHRAGQRLSMQRLRSMIWSHQVHRQSWTQSLYSRNRCAWVDAAVCSS